MKPASPAKITMIVFAVVVIISCKKEPLYPTQPVISYVDFLRYGTFSNPDSVALVVSFTDNEGDISLEQKDKQGILKDGNLFMDLYFWDTTGVDHWEADNPYTTQIDTIRFAYTVNVSIPKSDKGEPMNGMIHAKQYPFINPFDKIKYVVYLYDKAMHKSDTIHTPAILF